MQAFLSMELRGVTSMRLDRTEPFMPLLRGTLSALLLVFALVTASDAKSGADGFGVESSVESAVASAARYGVEPGIAVASDAMPSSDGLLAAGGSAWIPVESNDHRASTRAPSRYTSGRPTPVIPVLISPQLSGCAKQSLLCVYRL